MALTTHYKERRLFSLTTGRLVADWNGEVYDLYQSGVAGRLCWSGDPGPAWPPLGPTPVAAAAIPSSGDACSAQQRIMGRAAAVS